MSHIIYEIYKKDSGEFVKAGRFLASNAEQSAARIRGKLKPDEGYREIDTIEDLRIAINIVQKMYAKAKVVVVKEKKDKGPKVRKYLVQFVDNHQPGDRNGFVNYKVEQGGYRVYLS